MAAGVRITIVSYPPTGENPEYYDTTTYSSVANAIAGISSGFLAFTPVAEEAGETGESTETTAIAVSAIKAIVAATL
jgi:hypothetical protein